MAIDSNIISLSGASAIAAGGVLFYFLRKMKSKLRKYILRSGGKLEED